MTAYKSLTSCWRSGGDAAISFRPIDAVAVLTGKLQLVGRFGDRVLIARLRRAVQLVTDGNQLCDKLLEVSVLDGHRTAVLTASSGHEEERTGVDQGQCGLIDGLPSGIDPISPLEEILRRAGGRRLLREQIGWIVILRVEEDIRVRERDPSHHLREAGGMPEGHAAWDHRLLRHGRG